MLFEGIGAEEDRPAHLVAADQRVAVLQANRGPCRGRRDGPDLFG